MNYILDITSISDLVNEIQLEIDSTLNSSVVATWIRSNISLLNNRIHTNYSIEPTSGEPQDTIDDIYKNNSKTT